MNDPIFPYPPAVCRLDDTQRASLLRPREKQQQAATDLVLVPFPKRVRPPTPQCGLPVQACLKNHPVAVPDEPFSRSYWPSCSPGLPTSENSTSTHKTVAVAWT